MQVRREDQESGQRRERFIIGAMLVACLFTVLAAVPIGARVTQIETEWGVGAASFADLTGDGVEDLVITGSQIQGDVIGPEPAFLAIYRNDGRGQFFLHALRRSWHFGKLVLKDVDRSGLLDLITPDAIWLDPAVRQLTRTSYMPYEDVAIGDFDADGSPDLAAFQHPDKTLKILGFEKPELPVHFAVSLPDYPRAVTAGDFDGDGFDDVAVVTSHGMVLIVNGSFAYAQTRVTQRDVATWLSHAAVADLNGDRRDDLVVYGPYSNAIYVLYGEARGVSPATKISTLHPIVNVTVGDLTGNGRADIIALDYIGGFLVYEQEGAHPPRQTMSFRLDRTPYSMAVHDVDHDGNSDLVVAGWERVGVSVIHGPILNQAPDRRRTVRSP